MIRMTYDEFDELYDKMEALPSVIYDGRGLTEKDLSRLEAEPDKYMAMIIYYLTRNFKDDEVFSNEDAIPGSEIKLELNQLVRDNIEFVEE